MQHFRKKLDATYIELNLAKNTLTDQKRLLTQGRIHYKTHRIPDNLYSSTQNAATLY